MTHTSSGIFTQPGPDGIFGRGGEPGDPGSPAIDADGTPLRETLVVAYPSPGHMRVARAIRHPQNGKVEFQEEYRVPTPEEVALLAQQGVTAGQGSMVVSQNATMPSTMPSTQLGPTRSGIGAVGDPPADAGFPWLTAGIAVVVGAAGFWAVNKWVVPKLSGDRDADDADDGDDDDIIA